MLLITKNAEFAESVSERVNITFDGSVVYSGSVTGVVQNLLGNFLLTITPITMYAVNAFQFYLSLLD